MRVHPITISMHQQHNKPVLQNGITIKRLCTKSSPHQRLDFRPSANNQKWHIEKIPESNRR